MCTLAQLGDPDKSERIELGGLNLGYRGGLTSH